MGAKVRTRLVEDTLRYLDGSERARFNELASEGMRAALATAESGRPGWSPIELFAESVALVARVRSEDPGACWGLGKFVAVNSKGPVQELAARVLRPSMIVSLAPSLFTTHFQDAGRVSVRAVGERTLVVTIADFPDPTPASCAVIGGWMEGWLASGPRSKIKIVHTACRCERASVCEYVGSWEV